MRAPLAEKVAPATFKKQRLRAPLATCVAMSDRFASGGNPAAEVEMEEHMIHALGTAHAGLRATKRSKAPAQIIVEVRKRRRLMDHDEREPPREERATQDGRSA